MQNSQSNSVGETICKDDFRVAELSGGNCGEIQELEKKISQNMGKQISLVAYENHSH